MDPVHILTCLMDPEVHGGGSWTRVHVLYFSIQLKCQRLMTLIEAILSDFYQVGLVDGSFSCKFIRD